MLLHFLPHTTHSELLLVLLVKSFDLLSLSTPIPFYKICHSTKVFIEICSTKPTKMNAVDNLVNLIDQLQNIESSMTRIMSEMTMKLCSLTNSSVLLVVQSNNVRRISGTDDLKSAYLAAAMKPLPTDLEVFVDLERSLTREHPLATLPSGFSLNSGSRKRGNAVPLTEDTSPEKRSRLPEKHEPYEEMIEPPSQIQPSQAPVVNSEFVDIKPTKILQDVEISDNDSDIDEHGPFKTTTTTTIGHEYHFYRIHHYYRYFHYNHDCA